MASTCDHGLQVGAGVSSSSEVIAFSLGDQQDKPSGGGNTEVTGERCNKGSKSLPRPISQSHISGTQERWFFPTSSQPEATEPVPGEVAFQDREPRYDKRPAEMQRLDGLHRPERCILVGGNLVRSSEISPFSVAEESV